MADPPTPQTSFVAATVKPPAAMVWSKPDSTWAWSLTARPGGRTRLVTRLKQRYRLTPAAVLTVLLAEFGDFAMMRKMLLGIKQRAEQNPGPGGQAATPGPGRAAGPAISLP